MIEAVVFDMDGVMINTEPIQSKAFEIAIRDAGATPEITPEGIIHIPGVSSRDNLLFLKEKYNVDEDVDQLLKRKREVYLELLPGEIKPMPGLLELLEMLKAEQVKLGIASSSIMDEIRMITSALNIDGYFSVIQSGEFFPESKPHPAIYQATISELKVEPEHSVALEDSEAGVQSARGAGVKVIAVPNVYTKNQNFSDAQMVFDSLNDLSWENIRLL